MARRSEATLTRDEAGLAQLMSDVSEECYCAGWESGCEFDIWRLCTEGGTYGQSGAEWLPQLPIILAWAERIDRWIIWDDGEKAIALDKWRPLYEAERKRREVALAAYLAKQATCTHEAGPGFLNRCRDCSLTLGTAEVES